MNHMNTAHEQVSALADGYLDDKEFAQVVGAICADDELRATWHTYHLVGDVLRAGEHTPCRDSSAFLSRFQQRLAAEPSFPKVLFEAAPPLRRLEAANEPVFRWKLVAGVASLAAAAAIGWSWVAPASGPAGARLAQTQQSSSQILAASSPPPETPTAARSLASTRVLIGNGSAQVMLRDPRLDQLLEAHRQAGGATQMPSSFLRNATFEGQSR